MLGYKILDKQLNVVEEGTVKYKTSDTFERYTVFAEKDNKFKQMYNEGFEILLYKDGEHIDTYLQTPTVYLDKWDNYNSNDPKRLEAILEVLEALKDRRRIRVSFDYEGRTRHETAAHIFANRMQEMGYNDFNYRIGYNYFFEIEHTNGVPVI